MPPFGPIRRKELIHFLKKADFEGPFTGGKHEFLVKGDLRLVLPNPHLGDIGRELLIRILHQAGISRNEWEKL